MTFDMKIEAKDAELRQREEEGHHNHLLVVGGGGAGVELALGFATRHPKLSVGHQSFFIL